MRNLNRTLLLACLSLTVTGCGGGGDGGNTSVPAPTTITSDDDGDGVINTDDSCPATPSSEPVDANGCAVPEDSDSDGVNDTNDACPDTANGETVDANGCVIPQDSDRDGVTDTGDQCPDTPAGDVVGADGCTALSDSDGDSIIDVNDQCPDTARGDVVDTSGCTVPSDGDSDGVIDTVDRCAGTPVGDVVDGNGCTVPQDSDNDGVIDANDQCPDTPSGDIVGTHGCAVPSDSDGDGVHDAEDQCPGTPDGDLVDATGCTIQQDGDGDGIDDAGDSCPNTPPGGEVDTNGCALSLDGIEVTAADDILVGGAASARPGFALYVFDGDLSSPGTSTCLGGCAASWPPLFVTDGQASGVSDLGLIDRPDGGVQATFSGRPLYYYAGDAAPGETNGAVIDGWQLVPFASLDAIAALYDSTTTLEPVVSFVRSDGVVVTRFGDRGRDRHAKDIGFYDPNNIFNSDHYDHWLAHYWEYRTARLQFEDHVRNGQSLIRATYITEHELGAREFRVWYFGLTTTGQFHFNPTATYVGKGTWNDDFVKTSEEGHQYMYTLDITTKWENGGEVRLPLQQGMNMEFEVSQFLLAPPAGSRLNYYGTSFVYVIGMPGLAPFQWQRGVNNPGGSNDGTPIPVKGLLGGAGTLGYNYSEEPAGRFMQMATNLSPGNAQPFVRGRRVHHTNFANGQHGERLDNPVWTEQVGKAGNHYVNLSCAGCHVRNGRALVADVGMILDKWVFKVGSASGNPDPLIGKVLQPSQIGGVMPEGTVTLDPWTELPNGLRSPNYVFSNGAPARFSARIAPQLVGLGLLEAVAETTILEWAEQDDIDANGDGITGRASLVSDPETGAVRLGRFGYKASTFSVRHQAAAALNADIGVMTSMIPDPDCGNEQVDCGAGGAELADDQLDDLVKYISLLGVGARRDYDNTAGEMLFGTIGCAGCHRPTMTTSNFHPLAELRGQTIHPYTDMLLHDMGAGLADNLGEGMATGAEWRTAALWGLGHSRNVMLGDAKANDEVSKAGAPDDVNRVGYLHDGRARTLDEAIRWHGGEANASKQAYEALAPGDQQAVLEFLNSL